MVDQLTVYIRENMGERMPYLKVFHVLLLMGLLHLFI